MAVLEAHEAAMAQVHPPKQLLLRAVADYLLAEGHASAAEALSAEAGVEVTPEALEGARRRAAARQAAAGGRADEALELAGGEASVGPDLAFRLHRQRVVELALRGDAEGAMAHAAETLAPAAAADSSGAKLAEMEGAVALAAFDAPAESPLADLAAPATRRETAAQLNAAMLRAEGRPGDARLTDLLRHAAHAEEACMSKAPLTPALDAAKGELRERNAAPTYRGADSAPPSSSFAIGALTFSAYLSPESYMVHPNSMDE